MYVILSASALQVCVGTSFSASMLIITMLMIYLVSKYLTMCGLSVPCGIPCDATPSSCKIRRGYFSRILTDTTNYLPSQRMPIKSLPEVVGWLRLFLSGDVELNPGPLDQGSFTCTSRGCMLKVM